MTPVTKNALLTPSGDIRPGKEIVENMQKLPLPERYDIYIQGMHRIHPPYFRLVNGIIPLGGSAIEFLKDKLKSKSIDSWDKIFILQLLAGMSSSGCYDVKSDSSLMKVITDTQNDILTKDPDLYSLISNFSDRYNDFGRLRSSYEVAFNIKCSK